MLDSLAIALDASGNIPTITAVEKVITGKYQRPYFSVLAMRLAGKSIAKMTNFVSSETLNSSSISQSTKGPILTYMY